MGKIHELIKETYEIQQEVKELKERYERNKAAIQAFFDKKELKTLEVHTEDVSLKVTKKETMRVNYFLDKLKEALSGEIYNEIVDKQYIITDIESLKALLKEAGVSGKQFKECILVIDTLNKAKMNQLYSVGDITRNDLKGCYEAKLTKSIVIEVIEKEKGE